MELTQKYLKECLSYNPETGEFIWIERPEYHFKTYRAYKIYLSRNSGSVAGNVKPTGYREVRLSGAQHKAHRIAFLYMTGKYPYGEVDHINNNKDDNRWCNLRDVTSKQNCMNRLIRSDSKNKYKGVTLRPNGKYQASITVNNKRKTLGTFDTEIDAAKAYNEAAISEYGEFASINLMDV